MKYRVRLTKAAAADLERRIVALAERSTRTANRLADRFEQALFRLRDRPLSCGPAHESSAFSEELRHLLFWVHARRKYRALFVVREDEVVILAIRAPGEKPVRPEDVDVE